MVAANVTDYTFRPMRIASPQPAARASITLLVAAWLVLAPVLVICTCPAGHAAVASAGHVNASCDHACPDASNPSQPTAPDAPEHQDTELVIDVIAPRSADVIALPACDYIIALLPAFDLAPSFHRCAAFNEQRQCTGPPAPIVQTLASTILLI